VRRRGDRADAELGLYLQNVADARDLFVELAPMGGGQPAERLNDDVDATPGHPLMPDAGYGSADEDDRERTGLAVGQCPRGRRLRKEQVTRVAADGCGSADANDPGLDPAFKLVGGNKRDDGSIDLLAEYNTVSHHSSVSLATSSMMDQTTYKAYDVVVVSFKPDGRIIYTHLPKKQEESPFWAHISIRYMNHGNDLVLFYNDNKKNFEVNIPIFS